MIPDLWASTFLVSNFLIYVCIGLKCFPWTNERTNFAFGQVRKCTVSRCTTWRGLFRGWMRLRSYFSSSAIHFQTPYGHCGNWEPVLLQLFLLRCLWSWPVELSSNLIGTLSTFFRACKFMCRVRCRVPSSTSVKRKTKGWSSDRSDLGHILHHGYHYTVSKNEIRM